MGFCDSGMVSNYHFVLCKAALMLGLIRWIFSWVQKLVKNHMSIRLWPQDRTTQSSSTAGHFSLDFIAMVKDHLSLTTFDNIKKRLPGEESHGMSCAVCLKRFKQKNQVWELSNCRHVFHKECLDRWLLYDARLTCPLCRTSLITVSSETFTQQHQQPPSWAVERILYLFGDDLLCASSHSSGN